jgi:hypothetical protein
VDNIAVVVAKVPAAGGGGAVKNLVSRLFGR